MSDLLSNPADTLSYLDISFLTFEAVLQVVIICFAGFISAKSGVLNTQGQKVLGSLNVDLFTPCLIFSKLAKSLSLSKLIDLIIIPIFYAVSTFISFICSKFTSWILNLNEPEADFVTAMAVFGNSNSLPVSLTLSLANTLPGLLWDDIPDDDSEKVAGRGILYLLIFQQLGQILRWSWGYNKLLRKRSNLELNTYYTKNGIKIINEENCQLLSNDSEQALYMDEEHVTSNEVDVTSSSSSNNSISQINNYNTNNPQSSIYNPNNDSNHQDPSSLTDSEDSDNEVMFKPIRLWDKFIDLPGIKQFKAFMNPPLYAMLLSVIVASTPLQKVFFETGKENGDGSFIHNTLTEAITSLGSVSIPLILIVLGSNLYPSKDIPAPSKHYNRILFGSLLSRMILPSLILLPIIALCVKYINISILDDPIFLIVAFILTISPPAIQLSQISQLNGIYQKEMSGVLFWGYVVLTLPTTIFIVVCSLEVLEWANPN
ncbi:hypothetical protein KGF54_002274 [Candida jiufengensis]|uniref:uncharacterized protein n=1 Tax=Candida jiufengensis TaxID=497108 RepID=UPI0022249590|nr:uncharacterized protein KGF54_002274 [Candida jiufengensis]KAI5954499.1 hypothetical protein KGF54_002274 [Candida jiufengensis]